MSNPHEVLELPASAALEDVKKAYPKLALRNHPDKNAEAVEKAHEEMVKVNAAYGQLTQQLSGSPAAGSGLARDTWAPNLAR
jgi:curved DNA-binding protein CbpA